MSNFRIKQMFKLMSRFRIVRRPGFVKPSEPIFDVEKRIYWLFWEHCGSYMTYAEAWGRVEELATDGPPIKKEVIYEKH
jgi:hypothetical protein